jgi:hypothetical protein
MKKLISAVAVLSVLALAPAAIARDRGDYDDSRGDSGRPRATFFVKDKFEGRGITVDRPIPSMREFDINDKISSISIESGRWLVCVDDDFRGRCEVIRRSVRHLGDINMDDKISSARPLGRGER